MKRARILIVSVILTVALCLCGGCRDEMSPNGDKQFPDKQTKTITVYVYGAVQKPGYHKVPEGTDVQTTVLEYALIADNGVLPADGLRFVKDGDVVAVDYSDGEVTRRSVNINGIYVTARLGAEGVDGEVVNLLADYIQANGIIRNYAEMAVALGNFYKDNYYKFFVSEVDYREAD